MKLFANFGLISIKSSIFVVRKTKRVFWLISKPLANISLQQKLYK